MSFEREDHLPLQERRSGRPELNAAADGGREVFETRWHGRIARPLLDVALVSQPHESS